MNPFGGEPARYEDRTPSLRAAAPYFKAGDARIELAEAHAWGDTLVFVMIERQHGEVGGLPDQDWPLRVTQVYRRRLGVAGGASPRDPLVRGMKLAPES